MSGASVRLGLVALVAIVAAIATAPTRAEAQRVQPSSLHEVVFIQHASPSEVMPMQPPVLRAESGVSLLEQQRDTTPARRLPLLDRLSTEQQIGLAGIVVAGMTLVVANSARAREPVRSGFTIDQRPLVAAGAILGASVAAIWIERRKREVRDAR